jgi:hypothetical protein
MCICQTSLRFKFFLNLLLTDMHPCFYNGRLIIQLLRQILIDCSANIQVLCIEGIFWEIYRRRSAIFFKLCLDQQVRSASLCPTYLKNLVHSLLIEEQRFSCTVTLRGYWTDFRDFLITLHIHTGSEIKIQTSNNIRYFIGLPTNV